MNRRDRSVVGVLVALLLVVGVAIALPQAPPSAPAEAEEPSPTPTLPPQAVYREGVVGAPTSITPVTARTRSDRLLVGLVFSGLVKLGPGTTYQPDLAASWTVNDTGTTWTFTIRDDALWQDGEPVTSADVVYTVKALQDPDATGAAAAAWADVAVSAPDDRTVVFTLGKPLAGFLAAATQPLLPSHLLADVPLADLATSDFAQQPVGSGPYAIAEIDTAHAVLVPSSTVLPGAVDGTDGGGADGAGPGASTDPGSAGTASPSSTAAASPSAPSSPDATSAGVSTSPGAVPAPGSPGPSAPGSSPSPAEASGAAASAVSTEAPSASAAPDGPVIPRIEITFFADEASLTGALAAGEIGATAGLSTDATARMEALPGIERRAYPTSTLESVLLNLRTSHPELRDPKTREALLMAIDRDALVSGILGGNAVRADTYVPPGTWAYEAAKPTVVPYDPAKAKALLKKAGWSVDKRGKLVAPKAKAAYTMELVTVPGSANARVSAVAAFVRDAWKALGMSVTIVEVPAPDLSSRLREGDFSAAVIDINEGLEPDLYPLLASTQVVAGGSNLAGFQNAGIDKLLEAVRKPGTDKQRLAAWQKLRDALQAAKPILPLAWLEEIMVSRGLENAQTRLIRTTGDRYWDVLAWRLAADR